MLGTLKLDPGSISEAVDRLTFRTQAFIGGRFVDAADGRTYTVENPATGKPLAEIAECGLRDVELAVEAARQAADSGVWSRMSPADRKRILVRFADLIDENVGELALIESLDAGKPISDMTPIGMRVESWQARAKLRKGSPSWRSASASRSRIYRCVAPEWSRSTSGRRLGSNCRQIPGFGVLTA
jgi:hypothetical protein